jgi:hypothetical protein
MFTNVRMHIMENCKINTTPVFTFTYIYTFRNFHAGGIVRTVSVSVNLESKTLAEAKSTKFCILVMVPQNMLYPDFFLPS